jgi:hypothetical protein
MATNNGGGVPVNQPSPNQTGYVYDIAAVANGLVKPEYFETVYDQSGGRNKYKYPVIVERIRRQYMGMDSTPRRIDARGGVFNRWVMGERIVSAVVSSASINGNLITITWQNSSYSLFRQRDMVINTMAAGVTARVVSGDFTAGYITIGPIDDNISLNLSDWNVAGRTIVTYGNAQESLSRGRQPLYDLPYVTTNYTQTMRESVKINRMDTYQTWATESGRPWAYAQQTISYDWLVKQMCLTALVSQKGWQTGGNSLYTRTYMGLNQAIGDPIRGGVYQQFDWVPQIADFTNYWTAISNKRNYNKTHLLHIVGRQYLSWIQTYFTNPLITPTGVWNTLESMENEIIHGLDAYTFAQDGIEHAFIYEPALDDPGLSANKSTITGLTQYGIGSMQCYTLDIGDFEDPINQMRVPAMEQLYFGEQPIRMGLVHGLAQNPFLNQVAEEAGIGIDIISTSEDSNAIHWIVDTCHDNMCAYMGFHGPLN